MDFLTTLCVFFKDVYRVTATPEFTDVRTKDWFLVSNTYFLIFVIAAYLYIVRHAGPSYMKNKPPYDLKWFIQLYNIFQVIVNARIVYYLLKHGLVNEIILRPLDRSLTGDPLEMAKVLWWLMIIKLVDFIETFVFVLRKKQRQISFLHVYHHIATLLLFWLIAKLNPGGALAFQAGVNCSIHVIMYSYYFASALGPEISNRLTSFKKYLTMIQMVQFIVITLHTLQGYQASVASFIPRWTVNTMMINMIINIVLFSNFYWRTYVKSKSS